YSDITKNERIITACELLQGSAGDFSYSSVFGQNKTTLPIKIFFVSESNDNKIKNTDAYGVFVGKRYEIRINSRYINAPSEALAPVIAREALVNTTKTSSDREAAKNLQIAVWSQMLDRNPNLENYQHPLVVLQNKIKAQGNPIEYTAFLNEAKSPQTNQGAMPKEVAKAFGDTSRTSFKKQNQTKSQAVKNFDKNQNSQADVLSFDDKEFQKKYKKISSEDRIIEALELLKDTVGKFSYEAILGDNLTKKPMAIKFKDLSEIKKEYSTFDALGWRQAGKLNIYINHKHADAPAAAIAAILAHEALHQDEFDSLNEETYAWTMEASVWTQLCDKYPNLNDIAHPLVTRENLLKKLLEKGNYSDKYIKKSVFSNPSYSSLPVRSPGFEGNL
ncbi:MAG: hypothetical protein ACI37T_07105, partial [Candidatus Gastranaerophilaceae bacterium]